MHTESGRTGSGGRDHWGRARLMRVHTPRNLACRGFLVPFVDLTKQQHHTNLGTYPVKRVYVRTYRHTYIPIYIPTYPPTYLHTYLHIGAQNQ